MLISKLYGYIHSPTGIKPCLTCKNVFGRVHDTDIADGGVSIKCADKSKLDMHTNDSLYHYYDTIACATIDYREELQKFLGIKVNIHGIMHCQHIRSYYKPIDHMLRDPMHVLISNGVGNAHIACLMKALIAHKPNAKPSQLQSLNDFVGKFKLPHRHGTVGDTWLSRKRFGKKFDGFASFAGIMLTIIPIIDVYLHEIISDTHALHAHRVCFKLLTTIVGICFLGPDDVEEHVYKLEALIASYVGLFSKLYPQSVTPKLHQLLHITDNIHYLHKLLSCFVTERKHRQTKRAALFVFRHIDNTVITDMVNRQCDAVHRNVNSLFDAHFLVSPKTVVLLGVHFHRSKEAVLKCGLVRAGDLVYLYASVVGKVICFWKNAEHETISVQIECYTPLGDNNRYRICTTTSIVDCDCVMDTLVYCECAQDEIYVIFPFRRTLHSL